MYSVRLHQLIEKLTGLNRAFELILVNDGSTDESLEKVVPLLKDSPSLKVITYSKNRGRGYAIRTGVKHAEGAIIVVTESDLSWGLDIVERL